MRDHFDISGVFETSEFEIMQVACIVKYMATHIHAKAFVGSQGGTILYKTFSKLLYISYKN